MYAGKGDCCTFKQQIVPVFCKNNSKLVALDSLTKVLPVLKDLGIMQTEELVYDTSSKINRLISLCFNEESLIMLLQLEVKFKLV